MSDPSNLSLRFDLVRFQVDLSRTEFRHSNPDNLKQRTLQSLAHSLGLEYEYCLRTREARITRSDVPISSQAEISHSSFDQQIVTQGLPENTSGNWPGIEEGTIFTRHSDFVTTPTDELGTLDWDFGNDDFTIEEFDWDKIFGEHQADEKALESSELLDTVSIPTGLPNGQGLLQHWEALCGSPQFIDDFVPNNNYISRDPVQGQSPVRQCLGESDKGDFGSSSKEICHKHPSTPAIHDRQFPPTPLSLKRGYEDLSDCSSETSLYNSRQAGSRRGSRSGSRVGSGVGSSSGSIGSLNSDRGRGRITSIFGRRPSMHRGSSSPRFQEFIFDANQSRPSSTTSTSSRRHKPLNSIALAARKAVKAVGACWRCRFLRKQVDQQVLS
jgi:hypothetical protein